MIKTIIKGWREGMLIGETLKKANYYTHIDDLPVYNFAQILNGKYEYIYKLEKDRRKKYPKSLFIAVFQKMYFQFKKLDNSYLRDKAKLTEYWSKWIRTNDYRWKNEHNTLEAKLEKEDTGSFDLNDFTDFIELTFNQINSIDVHKTSTSKAYSLYYKAIDKIKSKKK